MDRRYKTPESNMSQWNWAAFLLTFIWGVGNRVWISLLALIPVVNIIMAVILGIYGNRWAWRNSDCISEHEFRQNQKSWTKWAVVTTATLAVFSFFVLYYISASLKSVEAKAVRDAKRVSDVNVVVAALSHYQYDHSGSCPLQLTELSPKYLEETLEPLQAQSYDLRQEDGRCIISVELESRDNLELGEDYIKGNGAIYDRATEDLENLIFYNE